MPAKLDIALQRNEDYAATWFLKDKEGGPIDITGWTVELQVRAKVSSALIAEAEVELTDPEMGEFTILLEASAGSALAAYGDPLHDMALPYDLLVSDTEDVKTALCAGRILLSRGVSA